MLGSEYFVNVLHANFTFTCYYSGKWAHLTYFPNRWDTLPSNPGGPDGCNGQPSNSLALGHVGL